MSNSQTGGYLLPTSTVPIPRKLTLVQFIQTVLVGVSGLPDTLVRPKWQPSPPKQPDGSVDWLAFGVTQVAPTFTAYISQDADGNTFSVRQETLQIACAFYGPNAFEISEVVRDGFQVQQNLEGLRSANMGFTETSAAVHIPDLVNEKFIDRYEMTIVLTRQVQRTYAITSFTSVKGTIHSGPNGDPNFTLDYDSTKHRS